MKTLLSIIESITGNIGVIAAWLVVPLIFATVYEVFSRYLLNAPTVWSFEIGYMMMGSHFLLGAAYTLREGSHVRVDLIYNSVSAKSRAIIDVVGYLFLILPIMLWLSWGLWEYFETSWVEKERSGHSSWNPLVWPYRLVFFISFFVLTLQVVGEILKGLQVLFTRSATARTL